MDEKKFTLRIGEEESEKLERLKKLVGFKTFAGVIKYVICQYEELNNRYICERAKNARLEQENTLLKRKINTFLDAFSNLKNE